MAHLLTGTMQFSSSSRLQTKEVTSDISMLQGQMKSEHDPKPSPYCGPVLYLPHWASHKIPVDMAAASSK